MFSKTSVFFELSTFIPFDVFVFIWYSRFVTVKVFKYAVRIGVTPPPRACDRPARIVGVR